MQAGAPQLGRSCWVAFWHRLGWGTCHSQGQHEPMMPGWHKKGEHYRKAHKHSQRMFFLPQLLSDCCYVLLESIGLKANRDQLGTTQEHHKWPEKHPPTAGPKLYPLRKKTLTGRGRRSNSSLEFMKVKKKENRWLSMSAGDQTRENNLNYARKIAK